MSYTQIFCLTFFCLTPAMQAAKDAHNSPKKKLSLALIAASTLCPPTDQKALPKGSKTLSPLASDSAQTSLSDNSFLLALPEDWDEDFHAPLTFTQMRIKRRNAMQTLFAQVENSPQGPLFAMEMSRAQLLALLNDKPTKDIKD